MTFNITKDQEENYKTVKWRLDPMGPRASERTQLMAMAFIEHSLYYGTWVNVFNHDTHPQCKEELIYRVQSLVSSNPKLNIKLKGLQNSRYAEILVSLKEREPFGENNPFQFREQDMNKENK